MVSIPGDRRGEDMHLMGRIAAGLFDEIVVREDPARRDRGKGEIVSLMAEGARAAGFPAERMNGVLDEEEAADTCLRLALPGDLVVLNPTELEQMWRQVLDWQPNPTRPKVEPVLRLPTLDGFRAAPDGRFPAGSPMIPDLSCGRHTGLRLPFLTQTGSEKETRHGDHQWQRRRQQSCRHALG